MPLEAPSKVGMFQWKAETFSKEVEQALLSVIAAKHEKDAYRHIWGCRAGNPLADYQLGRDAPPGSKPAAKENFLLARDYRERLQEILGGGQDSIAVEIAEAVPRSTVPRWQGMKEVASTSSTAIRRAT